MNKFNKIFVALLLTSSVFSLVSCANSGENNNDDKRYAIYELALSEGQFEGTYEEWLQSIKGKDGVDGLSAYELYKIANPEYQGTIVDWLTSLKGKDGVDGLSAFQLYKISHPEYEGTLEEWLQTVGGKDGLSAYELYKIVYPKYEGTLEEWVDSLKGKNGVNGLNAYELYKEAHPEYKGTLEEWFISLRGKDGIEGNGIKKIETFVDPVTKETTITIYFTDKEMDPYKYKVPSGISLKGVITTPNEDGSSTIEFEFSDGTKSVPIILPKGVKGDGYESYEVKDNYDGSRELILKFTNHDPISVIIPKGETGNGISTIFSYTNKSKYIIQVHYTNGEMQNVEFDKPNSWLHGNNVPNDEWGLDGDYFLNTKHKIIYIKSQGTWDPIFDLNETNTQICTITFDVNDDTVSKATMPSNNPITCKKGESIGASSTLPVPVREGYTFDGWYLVKNPNKTNGCFTDLTTVNNDITLYAKWIKNN